MSGSTNVFLLMSCFCYTVASVSDAELDQLMTSLWNEDYNRAGSHDVTYNPQSYSSTHSTSDASSHRLFTYVNEAHLFQKSTYATFIALLDNFERDVTRSEHTTSAENAEVSRFIQEVSKTSVMQRAYSFLHQKGYVTSLSDFEHKLKSMWFTQYSRSGHSHGSSGFEHVFVGEIDGSTVSGFHNWIQFYLEEKKGHLNYYGYVFTHQQPQEVGAHFKWYTSIKNLSTLLIGSSPEFDMAVYTTCYFARRGRCDFHINGQTFHVKTYDIDYVSGDQIGTAYFT